MSKHYGEIAFTDRVSAVQDRYGSRPFYARHRASAQTPEGPDPITPDVVGYLAARDSFYLATTSETGWPYVQYRGGPPGFLQVLDEHTLGWADFRGNLQYISTGNISGNDRVALLVMDYPERERLKIFGHARVVLADDEPAVVSAVSRPDYDAVVERAIVVSVDAYDWNCQQHIMPRYTLAELGPRAAELRDQITKLETENATMRTLLSARDDKILLRPSTSRRPPSAEGGPGLDLG